MRFRNRRLLVATFFLALSARLMTETLSQGTSLPDWPRFLGPTFDGIAPESPREIDWASSPQVLWTVSLGEGYGIGSVAQNQYFHFDSVQPNQQEVQGGGRVERLRCIDMDSGAVVWTATDPLQFRDLYGYETGPRSSPTIADSTSEESGKNKGQIFTLGVGGDLICRSLADGNRLWKVATKDEFSVVQNFFGVGSAPLVIDDLVVVMVGGSPTEDLQIAPGRLDRVSPNGTGLVAFDRNSGNVRWRSVDDLASYSSPRPISLEGRSCIVLYARDHLWCVDALTGDTKWKFRHRDRALESVNAMTPVVDGEQIFISECYGVGSVLLNADLDSADVLWKDEPRRRRSMSMRSHWATPILHEGFLYGCSGRNAPDSDFRCIEWSTGNVLWTDLARRRSSATLVRDRLLVLEERGTLHVIEADPSSWKAVAEIDLADGGITDASQQPIRLRYPCWSAPLVVGDRVLIRGDNKVVCLRWPSR